jgi:hypothetical protein
MLKNTKALCGGLGVGGKKNCSFSSYKIYAKKWGWT